MTREEALHRVKGYLTDIIPAENYSEVEEIIRALEKPRWIPVSKKLPKKSGEYWCTFGGNYFTGIDHYTTLEDAEKIFGEAASDYAGWSSNNVIAWQPLPEEPYKAESNEQKRN